MVTLLAALLIQIPDSVVTGVIIQRSPVPQVVQVRDTTPVPIELRITTVADTTSQRMNAEIVAALGTCPCVERGLPDWFLAGILALGGLGIYELHRWIDKPNDGDDVTFNDGDTNVEVTNPPMPPPPPPTVETARPPFGKGARGRGPGG